MSRVVNRNILYVFAMHYNGVCAKIHANRALGQAAWNTDATLVEPAGQQTSVIKRRQTRFQRQDEIDKLLTGWPLITKQVSANGSRKCFPVAIVKRRCIRIQAAHEGFGHDPHTLADTDVTGAHLTKRQIHVREHRVEQLLAEFGPLIAAALQPPHDKRHDQRQCIKPAINRVGDAMVSEKCRLSGKLDSITIQYLGRAKLAPAAPIEHISKPSFFLAFHHRTILLR
jgi:hypothetical protein